MSSILFISSLATTAGTDIRPAFVFVRGTVRCAAALLAGFTAAGQTAFAIFGFVTTLAETGRRGAFAIYADATAIGVFGTRTAIGPATGSAVDTLTAVVGHGAAFVETDCLFRSRCTAALSVANLFAGAGIRFGANSIRADCRLAST